MCLSSPKKIIQSNDITCYKVFFKYNDSSLFKKLLNYLLFHNKILISYFRGSKYKLGELMKINCISPTFNYKGNVEGDAIHSFVTLEDAVDFLNITHSTHTNYKKFIPCIVKCKIPENNIFLYKGVFTLFDDYPAYASQSLIPEEIIAEFTKNDD